MLVQSQARADPIVKYLAIGRQLGYAGYLTYDAANWVSPRNVFILLETESR